MEDSLESIALVIKSLVVSEKCSTKLDSLLKDYEQIEGRKLPYQSLGFASPIDLLHAIPEYVYLNGNIVKAVRNDKSAHVAQMVIQQKMPKIRPKRNRYSKKYAQKNNTPSYTTRSTNPHGNKTPQNSEVKIPLQKCETYQQDISDTIVTHKTLPSTPTQEPTKQPSITKSNNEEASKKNVHKQVTFNIETGIESAATIQTSRVDRHSKSSMLAHYRNHLLRVASTYENKQIFLEKLKAWSKIQNEAIPEQFVTINVFFMDFPRDVVKHDAIAPFNIHSDISSELKRIYILQFHSPTRFWYTYNDELLEEISVTLASFYKSFREDEYCIPIKCIRPGQVCAATYFGIWHRAKIVSEVFNNTVKVFYYDYGSVYIVENLNNIKFLHKRFACHPALAIRGSLARIQPNGQYWSLESKIAFDSIQHKFLLAAKDEIDQEGQLVYLNINFEYEKNMTANIFLLNQGFAKRLDNDQETLSNLRKNVPTFDMLELGVYPSLEELIELNKKGIDYDKIVAMALLNSTDDFDTIQRLPYNFKPNNPFKTEAFQDLYDKALKNFN